MIAHECAPGEVFVFGSNRAGIHGAGAARTARLDYGAVTGVGEGQRGQSYALPTVDAEFRPLPLSAIAEHAARFVAWATAHPAERFFLTRVGCGIAGYTDAEIAPLFAGAPDNVRVPPEWRGPHRGGRRVSTTSPGSTIDAPLPRGTRGTPTVFPVDVVVALYRGATSIAAVARQLHTHPLNVRRILLDAGVYQTMGDRQTARGVLARTLYGELGTAAVARRMGLSASGICRVLRRQGIRPRIGRPPVPEQDWGWRE